MCHRGLAHHVYLPQPSMLHHSTTAAPYHHHSSTPYPSPYGGGSPSTPHAYSYSPSTEKQVGIYYILFPHKHLCKQWFFFQSGFRGEVAAQPRHPRASATSTAALRSRRRRGRESRRRRVHSAEAIQSRAALQGDTDPPQDQPLSRVQPL